VRLRPARRTTEYALQVLAFLSVAALLVVMFYYPVATVLADAVVSEGYGLGSLVLDPLRALTATVLHGVLASEFYFGAAHTLFETPAAVPGGVATWLWTFVTTARLAVVSRFPFVVLVHDAGSVSFGLFGFTFYQAVLSTLLSVLIGLPGAWILARFEFPGRATVRSLTAVPFVMPSIMVAVGFVAMFGANGTVNDVLRALGLPTVELLYSLHIIVLAHAFYDAPLVARVTAAAWETVDSRMVESARSLGASDRVAFRHVVLPQLQPAILTGALLTFVFSFLSFAIVLTLGGLQYATVEVWVYHSVRQLEFEQAAGIAVLETALSLAVTYAYLRYEARQTATRAAHPPARRPIVGRLTVERLAVAAYAVVALVLFVGPIASMLVESVTGPNGFTLRNYAFLIARQVEGSSFQVKPLTAVRNSLLFGVGCLLLAVPMGLLVAVLSTRGFRGRKLVDALAMAPFAVSGVVVGLGLLRGLVFGVTLFGYRFTVTGPVAIVAAHAVGSYPFVVRNVAPILGSLDQRLVEAARSLGASRARALYDIELPLVASGVLAGTAFAFALSIGEFDSTVILATGGQGYTMPVAIERFIGRRLGPATAMGCVLLVVTAASFVVIDRIGEGFNRG
jgi:thiamine transport system permease protein